MPKSRTCRTCRFLNVAPDKAGRIRPQRDGAYQCIAPQPEMPPMPLSITNAYGFNWPPSRTYMLPDQDTECPVWEERTTDEASKGKIQTADVKS